MKKIISTLIICLVMFNVACNKKHSTADNSLELLKSRGVFVVGLDDSFAPMGFRDENNEIVGFDIDLAREVADRLGVTFQARPINWIEKENELNSNKIDCIWNGMTITESREQEMALTKPYLNNDAVLIVRNDSNIRDFNDLDGKVLGVQSGSSQEEAINANQDLKKNVKQVAVFSDNVKIIDALQNSEIDVAVIDSVFATYYINKNALPLTILDEAILINESYGIGFRKNDLKLRDAVWSTLEQMAYDGTVQTIALKWFGADITTVGK